MYLSLWNAGLLYTTVPRDITVIGPIVTGSCGVPSSFLATSLNRLNKLGFSLGLFDVDFLSSSLDFDFCAFSFPF